MARQAFVGFMSKADEMTPSLHRIWGEQDLSETLTEAAVRILGPNFYMREGKLFRTGENFTMWKFPGAVYILISTDPDIGSGIYREHEC